MLKSSLNTCIHAKNAFVKLRGRYQTNFIKDSKPWTFLAILSKQFQNLKKIGPIVSCFNPFPSLPSVTTDDSNQFQFSNMVFGNKTIPIS